MILRISFRKKCFKIIYKRVDDTDAIIEEALEPKYIDGDGSKSRYARCNNVFVNCVNVSSSFDLQTMVVEYEGIKNFFRKYDLRQIILKNIVFNEVLLSGAELIEAKLQNTRFEGKVDLDLRRTYLNYSILCDAKLIKVDLSRACLYNTDLRGVILEGVDLRRSNLFRADLRNIVFKGNPNLGGAELDYAKIDKPTFDSSPIDKSIWKLEPIEGEDYYHIVKK